MCSYDPANFGESDKAPVQLQSVDEVVDDLHGWLKASGELDPQGPGLNDVTARLGFYVKPGERLDWRTDLPLIVLGRGMPFPRTARDGSNSQTNGMTEEQFSAWDRIWRDLQEDLAKRSAHGEFRLAEKSGHFVQRDQPELIIQAIRDVSRTH